MNEWFEKLCARWPDAELVWAWITVPEFQTYQKLGFNVGDAYALLRVPAPNAALKHRPAYLLKTYYISRDDWFTSDTAWPVVAHLLQDLGQKQAIINEISDCYWDIYPRGMGPAGEKGSGRKVWDVLLNHGIREKIPMGPWTPEEQAKFESLCYTPENGWLGVEDPVAEVRSRRGDGGGALARALEILKEATRTIPGQNRINLIEQAIDLLEELNQDAS